MNPDPAISTPKRDFITIVSGLPRSGTSMLLQMLAAGGLEVLTDGIRTADVDNPRGYLEWEQVKSLKRDAGWIAGALGKAVKVIYCFLPDLPSEYRYRVLFMRRDLDEILASQAAMLARRKTPESIETAAADNARMKRLFENELREIDEWLRGRPKFSVLDVEYRAVLERPLEEARRIAAFLGGNLEASTMAAAVDATLYRNASRRG